MLKIRLIKKIKKILFVPQTDEKDTVFLIDIQLFEYD